MIGATPYPHNTPLRSTLIYSAATRLCASVITLLICGPLQYLFAVFASHLRLYVLCKVDPLMRHGSCLKTDVRQPCTKTRTGRKAVKEKVGFKGAAWRVGMGARA